jgi:hypothetical protein
MNQSLISPVSTYRTTLFRAVSVGLVVLTLSFAALFAAASANGACGDPRERKSGSNLELPRLTASRAGNEHENEGQNASIVGLWHVKYTAENDTPFLESFKTWHGDGTEFENAFLPPSGGNICFGVWKEVAPRTVRLHHLGLNFNSDGSISGSFTIDETDTVSPDGSTYKGTFDFNAFDASGHHALEIKGTMLAKRITVS